MSLSPTPHFAELASARRQPITSLLLTGIACCSPAAFAQVSAPAQAQESLPVVVVDAQREEHIQRKQSAVATIIIGEQEIERFGDATVGDVLKRLPGVSFTGPAGVVKDARIRGLEKGYTLFLINGEPVPTAKKDRQIQVDRIPADMIERIEIIRSPSASMASDGIGGAINIVLKETAFNGTRLRAAYGQNGSHKVGDALVQWSRRVDDLDIVLGLSHTVGAEDVVEDKNTLNATGAVTQREHKPKPVKKTETLLLPRVTWHNGADRLVVDTFFSEGTEAKTETSSVTNAAGVYTKGTLKTEDKNDAVTRLGMRYEAQADWGSWQVKAGVQKAEEDKDALSLENNASGVLTKTTLETELLEEKNQYIGLGATRSFGAHRVRSGVELSDTRFSAAKTKTENGVNKTAAADQHRVRENKRVLFIEDQWSIAKDHTLTAGLRWEDTDRRSTDAKGTTAQTSFDHLSPSLHYRWAIAKNTNVRASLSKTSKLPTFDQVSPLITSKSGTLSDPDTAGNPALRPERATGWDLGVEHFFEGHRGVVGVNLYNRDVKDYIQKSTTLEGSRYVQRPQNVSKARFWGLELDGRLPIAHKGPHQLTLTGNHAELRGSVTDAASGRSGDVKDMPPRITSIGVEWAHRPSKWSLGFHVTHQPAFTTRGLNSDSVDERKTRNASTMLDLYVTKVVSPMAEFRLVAKNLLSVKKIESTTKYTASGAFSSAESKTERSKPTVYLAYEARF